MPCSPIEPLRRMRSPGRARFAERRSPSANDADAGSVDEHSVATALFDDFGVTRDDRHAGFFGGVAKRFDDTTQRPKLQSLFENECGAQIERLAPPIARSFTVPWTASEPIFPPGKKSGFTTNESVVKASRERATLKICFEGMRDRANREMLDQVLNAFEIAPDYDLNLMRKDESLSCLAAAVLEQLSPVLEIEQPDWVVVQGDTTTAAVAALGAFYQRARVAHVEAGLESRQVASFSGRDQSSALPE